MPQYLIGKEEKLTTDRMVQIIQNWSTTELPKMKRWGNYYQGKHKIVFKQASSEFKPCNKIVTNFCKNITENFQGYLTGKPVTYSSNEDIESIMDVLNYNDVWQEDSDYLKDALIYGKAFEVNYIDGNGFQRFAKLSPLQCIPIYANDLSADLLYVIRCWQENEYDNLEAKWFIELYTPTQVKRFTSDAGFASVTLLSEEPHYFKQCPVTVMDLDESIFNQIISLQDAYNELLSSEVDSFQDFADAYLVLKGMDATEEEMNKMREHRILLMDTDATAEYLTKSVTDTQIQNMLDNINEQIYKKANCPDFSDENFGVSSGIALKYKLLGFENKSSDIESKFKKALQRRIELISAIEKLTTGIETWRDIKIEVNRNLPEDVATTANMVNSLRGLVSTETLLSQISFVADPVEEVKKLEAEKQANMELYSFGGENNEDDID